MERKTEHPILFSTPMVQAILQGRKTMTRRIVKMYHQDDLPVRQNATWYLENKTCPYGQPGDKLWVRESFEHGCMGGYIYKADRTATELFQYWHSGYKWKPSIHMPKAASRIWLEITNIKVERLQDITYEDAKREGVKHVFDKITGYCGYDYISGGYNLLTSPYNGFCSLWKLINGEESWKANPWVWVVEFKRIEKCQ